MTKNFLRGFLSMALVSLVLTTNCANLSDITSSPATLGERGIYVTIGGFSLTGYPYVISVDLKPANSAVANKDYVVQLYEKGKLREATQIRWNQPEINVRANKPVDFRATETEYHAYYGRDISHIFSVKVFEFTLPSPPQPTLTLIYPNGGEQWRIGDKVAIKWTSFKITSEVVLQISYDSGKTWWRLTEGIPNNGNYQWTVAGLNVTRGTPVPTSPPQVSTHCRIRVCSISEPPKPSASASDFTILE